MKYYILEKDKKYLQRLTKECIEMTEFLSLAYKFSCRKSALIFKETNELDGFKISKCTVF